MTKGIVTCNLYKRNSRPSVNAERMGHYVSGDEVEILDVVLGETENDYYEGTPTWYKLTGDIYVWSGGVSLDLDESLLQKKINLDQDYDRSKHPAPAAPGAFDLATVLNLTNAIPSQGTNDVLVAILDTGIDKGHPKLNDQVVHSFNYQKDEKFHNHGTQVAGLIVGEDDVIRGLSPQTKLLDLRVADGEGNTNDTATKDALLDILEWKRNGTYDIDVVNMSLDTTFAMVANLQPIIDDLVAEDIIVVVAGSKTFSFNTNLADLTGTFSIGTYMRFQFQKAKMNAFSSKLFASFENKYIKTTSKFPTHEDFRNSSAYTALVTGLIARYLSSRTPTSTANTDVDTFLKSNVTNISTVKKSLPFTPFIS